MTPLKLNFTPATGRPFEGIRAFITASQEYWIAGVLALLLVLSGKTIIDSPLTAVAVVGVLVVLGAMYFNLKLGLLIAMAGLMLFEEFDLSSTEAFYESGLSNSILAVHFFGVGFIDSITVLFFLPVFLREWLYWYRGRRWRSMPLDGYLLPIVVVYMLGCTQGLFNCLTFHDFIIEARDVYYLLVWYFIASRVLSSKRDVLALLAVLLAVFNVKSLLFVYRMIQGTGLFYGFDFYRPALGADVPFIAVSFITALLATILLREYRRPVRMALYALAAYWSVLFVHSLGRASYLTAFMALVIALIVLRKELHFRRLSWTIAIPVVAAMLYYYTVLTSLNRELVGSAIATAFNWVDAVTFYGDMSIGQRVLEIINISETLTRAGAWLWGLGWGAPWSEIVIKHPFDVASFEIMETIRGVHTYAHLDVVYFVLKVGILGALVIYAGYLRFMISAVRQIRHEPDRLMKLAIVCLLVMLIIFVPNYLYFVKLRLVLGTIFGCLSVLAADSGNAESGVRAASVS